MGVIDEETQSIVGEKTQRIAKAYICYPFGEHSVATKKGPLLHPDEFRAD